MKRKIISVFLILASFICLCPIRVYAADERVLLARAIESAASGESYTVMVSLASVLLNRVESDKYPASLAAAISDAGIDVSAVTPSSQAMRAARDAMGGFDPTDGALEYSSGESELPFVRLKTGTWCFY
ncbi:MAG: cell wall hydrolase [Clostridia bacterium]|nr:cell wall hydrolase [Clostridia bacterium]